MLNFDGNISQLVNNDNFKIRAYSTNTILQLSGTYVKVIAFHAITNMVTIKIGRRILFTHIANITFGIEEIDNDDTEENEHIDGGQSFNLESGINRITDEEPIKKNKNMKCKKNKEK